MGSESMNLKNKICQPQDLAVRLGTLPRPLVMTNGVFDVLHRGHVSYLHNAAELGASLLVAVNSDRSAQMLGKGPGRPINTAADRAYVLAGLESVNLLTFFDTRTPVNLIRSVRPDVYVKGGDYDIETLEETRLVRSWGGQSFAIPFVYGFSTTSLVNRIRQPMGTLRKAAFLDRDGVINKDKAYVHRWEDFEFVPGAIEGMRMLQGAGYALVIVTNQSGLARGYYTEAQYHALTGAFREHLAALGVHLDGVYHCPHHPKGTRPELAVDCDCRKPKPGMILEAARELGLALADSIMIGDKPSDIVAARAAGVGHAYLVQSDNLESGLDMVVPDGRYAGLLDCVTHLTTDIPRVNL
jgi:rfaE bifunctional protein nucleotidyltransferase chain/domain